MVTRYYDQIYLNIIGKSDANIFDQLHCRGNSLFGIINSYVLIINIEIDKNNKIVNFLTILSNCMVIVINE